MPNPDVQEPQPPELSRPGEQVRGSSFRWTQGLGARVVLSIADELDKEKAEMPRSLIEEMSKKGWFGITIPGSFTCANSLSAPWP